MVRKTVYLQICLCPLPLSFGYLRLHRSRPTTQVGAPCFPITDLGSPRGFIKLDSWWQTRSELESLCVGEWPTHPKELVLSWPQVEWGAGIQSTSPAFGLWGNLGQGREPLCFCHLWNGDSNAHLSGWLWELSEMFSQPPEPSVLAVSRLRVEGWNLKTLLGARVWGSSSLSLGFFIYELTATIPAHSVTENCSEE